MPEPEDVFTPKTVVSKEMFEARNEKDLQGVPGLQDRLLDALKERGCQIVIYGDTGVGKSSLLTNVAEKAGLSLVEVDCRSGMTIDEIISNATAQVARFKLVGRSRQSSVEASAETEAKVPFFAGLKARIAAIFTQQDQYEVIETPAFSALLKAMSSKDRSLIVLDNFQNIEPGATRTQVAQFMESLSDAVGKKRISTNIKFVVIGIADDPHTLLGASMSYVRRAEQIGVPRMPDEEIEEVLRRGFNLLDLQVSQAQRSQLTFFSDGFPYFAHLLGLYIGNQAKRDKVASATEEIVAAAIARAANSVSGSYAERLRVAYERSGTTQPRRQLVRVLAQSGKREWSYGEIVDLWQATVQEPQRSNYNFLAVALGQLATAKFGDLLDIRGSKGKRMYRFADPHIRPYVRISEKLDPL